MTELRNDRQPKFNIAPFFSKWGYSDLDLQCFQIKINWGSAVCAPISMSILLYSMIGSSKSYISCKHVFTGIVDNSVDPDQMASLEAS